MREKKNHDCLGDGYTILYTIFRFVRSVQKMHNRLHTSARYFDHRSNAENANEIHTQKQHY